ncbi:aminotransferase class I/II-fold pyridoxal phosphate-dependent enzyme [Candidatus Wolfebacteria bacterium]|nr:aminotransferase class I/II-fold pyridoxal phosphate-dependent enzyme [Candidatus Wolfebacteria bacterium]
MNTLIKNKKFITGKDWVWYAPNTTDSYGKNEISAVTMALKKGWLTTGKITQEFENKIANLFGKKYALFVNSGSSANLLALEVMKFPKGSEIITPACNFNTTVAPIIQTGLIPVFIDVELNKYTINVSDLEKALSKKTVAIMAPHLIGNFIDLEVIRKFCKLHKLVFIEDSCDTLGGKFKNKPSGYWSDITTTSFYASHIITAAGGGGMLMFNDKKLREKARIFRDWGRGISRHDEKIRSRLATFKISGRPYDSAFVFMERGYHFRATEIQAAFALAQLKRLKSFMETRRHNFSRIYDFFKQYEEYFILPESMPNSITNWLAFPLTIKKSAPFMRNNLVRYLEDHKIQTRPLFSGNIIKHPAYKKVKYRKIGDLKNSQYILEQSFLIGTHHGLTDKMIDYLFEVFFEFLKKKI